MIVSCCKNKPFLVLYYSPAMFRGKCGGCGKSIVIQAPSFPMVIGGASNVNLTDKGLLEHIKHLEKQLEEKEKNAS